MTPHHLTDDQFFQGLIQILGGVQGAGFSALGLLLVKWLVWAFEWKAGDMVGVWKLTIVSGLTVLSVVLSQTAAGVPVSGALCNGAVFAAMSVFMHNFYWQWKFRHDDKATLKAKKVRKPK